MSPPQTCASQVHIVRYLLRAQMIALAAPWRIEGGSASSAVLADGARDTETARLARKAPIDTVPGTNAPWLARSASVTVRRIYLHAFDVHNLTVGKGAQDRPGGPERTRPR